MSAMSIRRKYDDEFKRDAVRLLINSGRTVNAVAEEPAVERFNLGRWRIEHLKKLDVRLGQSHKKMSDRKLASPPVFDGMIAADGKLFISLDNGSVVCYR